MKNIPLDDWQYRIAENPGPDAIKIGRYWLDVGPGLAVTKLVDSAGHPAGVILGHAIDLRSKRLLGDIWQAQRALEPEIAIFVRDVLWSLGGQFLLVLATESMTRLYPDCSAQVPCVWDEAAKQAGSSAHALFDELQYHERFDGQMFAHLDVRREGWFPAGLTAHTALERLLPCHYLDLNDWRMYRFWPVQAPAEVKDARAAVCDMVRLVRSQFEAVIGSEMRLALGLTAGRETRALLACARPFVDLIDVVTVVGPDRHVTDSAIARRIAKDTGITHRELPRMTASIEEQQRFVRRGGHCNSDTNSWFHPSVRPLAESHMLAGGLGGEVGRAFFWRATDREDTEITPALLINRLGLPATPVLLARIASWLSALPPMNAYNKLDLAYLEMRMGPWYAVQFCSDPTVRRIAPLFTYPGLEILLGLPESWKRQNLFAEEIIRSCWPELLQYPFNSLGLVRDLQIKLQKLLSNPTVLRKKLRKLRRN